MSLLQLHLDLVIIILTYLWLKKRRERLTLIQETYQFKNYLDLDQESMKNIEILNEKEFYILLVKREKLVPQLLLDQVITNQALF